MKKVIVIKSRNATVTNNNFDIIIEAAKEKGIFVKVCNSVKEAKREGSKDDVYALSGSHDVLSLYYSGRKNIFHWVQGIIPEESYMRHGSRWRFMLLSWEEKLSLKHSKICAFVGEPMREHFEKKYGLSFSDYYIFPCFNTEINKTAFEREGKYTNNYFVYAGGLAVWQCFEKSLDIYKKIEYWGIPNTKMIVLTKDQEKAERMMLDKGIKNYQTGFTTPEELPNILQDAKFGFVIREDSPVNKVATPTKISTYLSCGLIPIFGKSVETFRRFSESMDYTVMWDDSVAAYEKIRRFMSSPVDSDLIKAEYEHYFDVNYSRESHKREIGTIFKRMIE